MRLIGPVQLYIFFFPISQIKMSILRVKRQFQGFEIKILSQGI